VRADIIGIRNNKLLEEKGTMDIDQINDIVSANKIVVLGLTLILGTAVGYALSVVMQPSQDKPYCQSLEEDLQNEHNTTSINCHEPGWVALSSESTEIENQTDMRCTCTRVENGDLTIFPIRAAE
jgi:hypothetical protein